MSIQTQLHFFSARAIRALAASLVPLALGSLAAAQTNFPEVEPNSNKAEATPAGLMVAGDTLTGTTTGTITTAGSTLVTSVDVYRVRTRNLPLGIYRHSLTITSAVVGHTGTIRGLNQTGVVGVGGTIGAVDTTFQSSSTLTTPPRFNAWYGFGKQEELYYRVVGTTATTAAYTSTLSTVGVAPVVVAGPFVAGTITITTVGQGHTTDTDLWVYDSNFNAIPTAGNDDEGPGGLTLQSRLIRSLPPGTYYVGISNFQLSNNQPAAFDDDFQTGAVMDFPNVIVNSSTTVALPLNLSISDGATTTPVLITKANPYEVVWVCFTLTFTDTILPGSDIFVSPAGGSNVDFAPTPLPPGFFGPGSDPFFSNVTLGGAPLSGTGLAGGTDTIVRRLGPVALPGCPAVGVVPIEIVALNLVSVNPINVSFNGGASSSVYQAMVNLTNQGPQPIGQMQIRRTKLDGGTFDSVLPVLPRMVFQKIAGVDGAPIVTLDPAPPVTLFVPPTDNAPWNYDDGGLGVPHLVGGTVDHDGNPGSPNVNFPGTTNFIPGVLKQGGDCFTPSVSPRRVTVAHTAPAHTHTVTPPVLTPPSQCMIFCVGDGATLPPCPCGNLSIVGDDKGCLNSLGIGGRLRCEGTAKVGADTFKLNASNVLNGPGLYIQSNGLINAILGDGKLCAGIGIVRLGVVFASNNASMYPSGALPLISVGGACNSGDLKHYQLWYRDSALFCTPPTNNLTNGVSVIWQ